MALSLREQLRKGFQANADEKAGRGKTKADDSENGVTHGDSRGDTSGVTKGDTGGSKGDSNGVTKGDTLGVTRRGPKGPTNGDSKDLSRGVSAAKPIERFRPANEARTKSEKALWKYLTDHPRIVISRNELSEEIRVPESTLEKILRRWAQRGWLLKSKASGNAGMLLEFRPGGDTSGDTCGDSTGGSKNTHLKIDRRENLSISQSRVELTWPTLARHGFGASQVDQIAQALAELGTSPDRVVQGLHHAEWEIEHGKMLDKNGQPVADPCSWVFRSLSRTGYYRKPPGYVSAEEQAARDEDERLAALARAAKSARISRANIWLDNLPADERKAVLRGFHGGNRDVWLVGEWERRGEPGDG